MKDGLKIGIKDVMKSERKRGGVHGMTVQKLNLEESKDLQHSHDSEKKNML